MPTVPYTHLDVYKRQVVDRLIQQALLQVLQPILDPTFSEYNYGFRPGRSAHQAVKAAKAYVQSGKRVVVDVDLEKFFDRVNHDILIDRLDVYKRQVLARFSVSCRSRYTWPKCLPVPLENMSHWLRPFAVSR